MRVKKYKESYVSKIWLIVPIFILFLMFLGFTTAIIGVK